MGVFIFIIFVCIFISGFSSGDSNTGYERHNYERNRKSRVENDKRDRDSFDETESFFDDYGNEHIVNEELYCMECDDFYDEF
ncbi:MAG: hypothetical protein E7267_00715 [Lachnospiraceae bacterium]|nr:hypothetical protein [Lachnospiraceae bacterium]